MSASFCLSSPVRFLCNMESEKTGRRSGMGSVSGSCPGAPRFQVHAPPSPWSYKTLCAHRCEKFPPYCTKLLIYYLLVIKSCASPWWMIFPVPKLSAGTLEFCRMMTGDLPMRSADVCTSTPANPMAIRNSVPYFTHDWYALGVLRHHARFIRKSTIAEDGTVCYDTIAKIK